MPHRFVLKNNNVEKVLVLFNAKGHSDKIEVEDYKTKGFDVVEIDLTWIKDGILEDEMIHFLGIRHDRKKWLYNKKIDIAAEKLFNLCEPMYVVERGLATHIDYCPIESRMFKGKAYANWIDDCCYCDYRFWHVHWL